MFIIIIIIIIIIIMKRLPLVRATGSRRAARDEAGLVTKVTAFPPH